MSESESEEEVIQTPTEPTEDAKKNVEDFMNSTYTINQYLRDVSTFTSLAQHEEHLRLFIAYMPAGFIMKEKGKQETGFRYKILDVLELRKYLNFKCEFRTAGVNPQTGKQTTKIVKYSPLNSINNAQYLGKMAYFDYVDLYTDRPDVLSLYRPPEIPEDQINEELAKKFIAYFETRVTNPEAFHEELSAHAYRFRHPDARFAKVFVHYSHNGNSGKSLLTAIFDMLYPHLSMIGIKSKETQSNFDGWMTQYLNLSFEELQNDEYRNKCFETFLKQATSGKTSSRRMYKETEEAEYRCIVSMNTNQDDLYGLVRADKPTQERLVILNFKDNPSPTPEEWDAALDEWGMNDKSPDYHKTSHIFAASLWHYLRFTYLRRYNTKRYYGADKWELIRMLSTKSERLPMRFVKDLHQMINPEFESFHPSNILRTVRLRKDKKEVYFITIADLTSGFNYYPKSGKEKSIYNDQSVQEVLLSIGWQKATRIGARGIECEKKVFDDWRKKYVDNEGEAACADDNDDEEDDTEIHPPNPSD